MQITARQTKALARRKALLLAKTGRSEDKIAALTGLSQDVVTRLISKAGMQTSGMKMLAARESAFRAAVEAVRNGATRVDAAVDHGVSVFHLSNRCRDAGIENYNRRGPNGRSAAAAHLVRRDGITISEAARRKRCTPGSARVVLNRLEREFGPGAPPISTRDARSVPWPPHEEAILGTASDREIAARIGRSWQAVGRQRRLLGIAPHRASRAP